MGNVLRGILCLMICCVAVPSISYGFLYDIVILEKSEISKLSDEALIDNYIDVLVEMEASKSFHEISGFSTEGYKKYKDLIRYRIRLSIEVEKRGLEVGYSPLPEK